eukprot:99014-Rhodomonas_salina.1
MCIRDSARTHTHTHAYTYLMGVRSISGSHVLVWLVVLFWAGTSERCVSTGQRVAVPDKA